MPAAQAGVTAENQKPIIAGGRGRWAFFFFWDGPLRPKPQRQESGGLNVGRLLALRPLGYFEGNLLAFLEGFEAVHVDGGEVREQIFAAIVGRDETIALRVIKPFDGTSCHKNSSFEKIPGPKPVLKLFEFQDRKTAKPVLRRT
jgi:hypothetical protein